MDTEDAHRPAGTLRVTALCPEMEDAMDNPPNPYLVLIADARRHEVAILTPFPRDRVLSDEDHREIEELLNVAGPELKPTRGKQVLLQAWHPDTPVRNRIRCR